MKNDFFNRVFKPYLHLFSFSYVKIFVFFFDHYIEQNMFLFI